MAACTTLLRGIRTEDYSPRRKWVRIYLVSFALLIALSSQVPGSPVFLIVLGLGAVGLLLRVVCFADIYLRYRHLDLHLKPSLPPDVWLWASAILIVLLTIYTLLQV